MDERLPARPADETPELSDVVAVARILSWVAIALVAAGVVALGAQLWLGIMPLWDDVHIPFAVNFWSEPPLFVQIHRLASGAPAYLPPYGVDSWTDGPMYLYVVLALDRLFEFQPSIVVLRLVSVGIGYLAIVPLVLALVGMRLRRRATGSWASTVVAIALSVALFAVLDLRAYSFVALHPDALVFPLLAGALAAVVWIPLVRDRSALLGTLIVLCFAAALTNLSLIPLVAYCAGALVIERKLTWTFAAAVTATLLGALFVIFALAPSMREWAVVIPAHLGYAPPSQVLSGLWREWTVNQPYQGYIVLAALAGIGLLAGSGARREALAWTCLLAGTFLAAYQGAAQLGGGPNNFWFFYVVALIPGGAAVDTLLANARTDAGFLVLTRLTVLAYVGLLTTSVLTGTYRHPMLPAAGRAALASAAARLRVLCAPGRTLVVTWFPDPLLDCPTARLSMWDAVGRVLVARSHGYRARIFLDDPIEPDVFVSYHPNPVPVQFVGRYNSTPFKIWTGYTYDYAAHVLDVRTPVGRETP